METIVKIDNLKFRYTSNYILKGINLIVDKGTCLGLLGSNGSGKTTLINCILGELNYEGKVIINNYKPDIYSKNFKRNIGIVLDNDILIDYLTLNEYLIYIGKLEKIDNVVLEQRINYWIKVLKIEEHRYRILKFFSHGMRKKVQLIAALIKEPLILIIDEPTNGLDVEMIYLLKNIINDLKKKGLTIIVSTHIISFIEDVCDKAAIINNGIIQKIIELPLKCNEDLESIFIKEVLGDGEEK